MGKLTCSSVRRGVWLLSILLGLFATQVFAQSDLGTITGFVHDPTGAVVPNITVVVKNEATGIERRAITNEDGLWSVTNIPPGDYSVTAEASGFKKYQSTGNKLDPNSTLRADIALQVGQATETVEVSASAQTLQTDSASVQQLISRTQIDALELNGRNPIFLANLQPGVVKSSPLSGLNYGLDSGGFNINGSRSQDNLITFDGAPAIRTRSNGTSIGVADVDSTQEIQVLTANYAAEYRSASGGQIRIVSKSGTSSFHGNLFEYFRNNVLNANSWSRNNNIQTKDVAPFHYNQYGYNIGGPAYIPGFFNRDKNKFFFFWGQEWLKYNYGDTANLTVPTALMRQGNFSELLNPNNPFYGAPKQINDPTTGQAFAGNIIPASQLSANGIGLLNAYPTPNTPFFQGNRNWLGTGNHTIDQRKDTLTADMYPATNHHIAFRRQNYKYLEYQPLDGGSDRTPKFFDRPNQTNSLNYVWTISPTMVNETLATVSLDDVYIPLDLSKGLFNRTLYGINYPYIFPTGKEVQTRIPTIKIPTFSDLNGGPYPSHSSGPIYDFSDNLTKVAGNHTLKFGVLYERSGQNDFDQINVQGVPGGTNNQNGQFGFLDNTPGGSGVGVANAALGLFDVYSEIGPRSYTLYRGSMWEWFAQDQWKVSNRLTLTYGIRHTIIIPFSAQWANMDTFDPAFYNPANAVQQDPRTGFIIPGTGDPYNGVVIPGSGFPDSAKGRVVGADTGQYDRLFRGLPSYYSNIHYGQFQPRVGVAWQVTDKTVVRAGGGRFFTRLGVSDSIFLGGNSPFQPIASISRGSVNNPGGGSQNLFPLTITSQDRDFKNPEAYAWNFTVQREIAGTNFEAAYIGRRGLHAQRERNINQLLPGTLQANPNINTDYLRPYKGFAILRTTNNDANSTYNALQLNWSKRFAKGLGFGISYTLGSSSDDGSSQRDVIPNAYNAHNLWGPSSFDYRHVLIINYVYELPFFKDRSRLSGKLLGGWQISGVTQAQTGRPVTIGANQDYAGVGDVANLDSNNDNLKNMQFWNINGKPTLLKQFATSPSSGNQWFATRNPDGSPIFTAPAPGTFAQGYVRNSVHGPGFQNWNVGLFKKFLITEQAGFEFRAEAFNFVNHPNWDVNSLGVDGNNQQRLGKVTNKTSERNLQLSLRFSF
jgi:Carboxypeptidase regulatory-like domain/TonB-dependent Receptor Plug Domain